MSETSTTWKHLERRPKSVYKQLSIKGRRIHARTLYGCYMSAEEPMTPEQIAEAYNLPLDAVHEAIAYCQTNPPEIAEDFAREEALDELMGMNDPEYKKTGKTRIPTAQEIARAIDNANLPG